MRLIKCTISFLLCVGLCAFSGCSNPYAGMETVVSSENYSIVTDGQKSYLRPSKEIAEKEYTRVLQSAAIEWPRFTSVSEMKAAIENGELSEDVVTLMQFRCANKAGMIEVCNPKQLYEAIHPGNIETKYLQYEGNNYVFDFNGFGGTVCGYTSCTNKTDYDIAFANQVTNFFEDNGHEISSIDTEIYESVETEILYYTGGNDKVVRYDASTENKQLYVQEHYSSSSKDIPFIVQFYGYENGTYFYGAITIRSIGNWELPFRPSVSFMQSFGLKPYVEAETE